MGVLFLFLTEYTYPDGTSVERTYTDRRQLRLLKHAGTTIDTRIYDNAGRMTGSSYNNGVGETRTYNIDNTLASISHSGASIGNLSYGWNDNKNKTSEAITGTMSGYGFSIPTSGYDAENRLVSYNRTNGNLDQSWSLSAVGDWDSVMTEGTTQSRTHGDTYELTAVAGQSVSTDTRGNTTLIPSAARPDSTALSLTWDADNRMSSADVGNNSSVDVNYQFDALGRRVARTASGSTTAYVQVGQQTIADYPSCTAASSPTFRYIYGSYIDEPVLRYQPSGSQSAYYHRNQQYSVYRTHQFIRCDPRALRLLGLWCANHHEFHRYRINIIGTKQSLHLHWPRVGRRSQSLPLPRPHLRPLPRPLLLQRSYGVQRRVESLSCLLRSQSSRPFWICNFVHKPLCSATNARES